MSGGSAAHAGIGFQDAVAGYLAVHVLADASVDFLDLPHNVAPVEIALETTAPVDDILLFTSDNGLCFINVKMSVALSSDADSPLGSVIDQFVRLWIACHVATPARAWQRPLTADTDRLVLVASPHRSQKLIASLASVLRRVRDTHSLTPRESIATTIPQQRAYDTVLTLFAGAFRRHAGQEPSDDTLISLLTMTRAVVLDPEGSNKASALALLKRGVLAQPSDAESAWAELSMLSRRLAEARSGADRATLRETLRSSGISLSTVPEIAADVRLLEELTRDTLASMSHLTHLTVPSSDDTLEIPRDVSAALTHYAKQASFLVIGEPGAGKSGALHVAATRLRDQGHPVVLIAVDRHPVHSLDALSNELRLSRSLLSVLRDWTTEKPGILFVDALDATRGGPSDPVFREIIRRVIREAPNWRVVASIRVFDLRFGVIYRQLFEGRALDERYCDPAFGGVRHLLIPQLSDSELEHVWKSSPIMASVHSGGSQAFRHLLRSPFNLFLLASLLSSGETQFGRVSTQLHLLHLYWSHRVTWPSESALERESLLRQALDSMLARRTLRIAPRDLPNATQLHRLQSDGVLSPGEGSTDRVSSVSFAHHVLFDYAVGRLLFEGGHAHDLAAILASSDDTALLTAPGALMAFEMLWEEDLASHHSFWQQAFLLAAAKTTGAFGRMLPARVAASRVQSLEDFKPVLDRLDHDTGEDRDAALFLVRHSTGALVAGLHPYPTGTVARGPWPAIVNALVSIASNDTAWMLIPLIRMWIEDPSVLSFDEKSTIGEAARRLLQHATTATYGSHIIVVAIQGVARTFGTAIVESAAALRELLRPSRVAAHGHEDLRWVVKEFDQLVPYSPRGPDLVADVYRAAFCAPLPSREEVTRFSGSRILSITSNKQQDFESLRYQLTEFFARFLAIDPPRATAALIDTVGCYAKEAPGEPGELHTFAFGTRTARLERGHGYLTLYDDDDQRMPPVRQFRSGLVGLADAHRVDDLTSVIDTLISRNRFPSIWAALLKAGNERPESLGRLLIPLLTALPVLDDTTTRAPAADLIAHLHPVLPDGERLAIEDAILAADSDARDVLLSYLDESSIQSSAARERRSALRSEGRLGQRLPTPSFSQMELDADWWLRDKGVDLASEANTSLNEATRLVLRLKARASGEAQGLSDTWNAVSALHSALTAAAEAPEPLRMSAWQALAEGASAAAEASKQPDDLQRFPGLDELLFEALDGRPLWPPAVPDAEREAAFAKFPSWGSPCPRVEAAGALMLLARAKGHTGPDMARLIERLARDPSPAVRHQILARTNMLYSADPPLMWRLCEIGFTEEPNKGVLSFFLPAVWGVVRDRPHWFAPLLLALDDRNPPSPESSEGRHELTPRIVELLLHLWLVYDSDAAGARVRTWTGNPLAHGSRVRSALFPLRTALLQGHPDRPTSLDERIRKRAIEVYTDVAQHLAPVLARVGQSSNHTTEELSEGRAALEILDMVAGEVYFASGAYRSQQGSTDEQSAVPSAEAKHRFLEEMRPTLEALARAPYPSITHHLLETLEAFIPDAPIVVFRLITDALLEGGRIGGYQFESLGSELFTRTIRRYLADFRDVIAAHADCRQRLVRALDVFVEAGWPEARRLVYDLPEMLR